jgi:plasmid maintenance system antidote protein VapI
MSVRIVVKGQPQWHSSMHFLRTDPAHHLPMMPQMQIDIFAVLSLRARLGSARFWHYRSIMCTKRLRRCFILIGVTFFGIYAPKFTFAAEDCGYVFQSSVPEVTYLQKLMNHYGDTPASVAALLRYSESDIRDIVSKRSGLTILKAALLAKYFGVSMDEFINSGHLARFTKTALTAQYFDSAMDEFPKNGALATLSAVKSIDGSTIRMPNPSSQANVRRALMILKEQDPNPIEPKAQVDLAIAVANSVTKNSPSKILTRQELSALLERQEFRIVK